MFKIENYKKIENMRPLEKFEDGLKSLERKNIMNVCFHNRTTKSVKIYWINYEGDFEFKIKIYPMRKIMLETFETHVWNATDSHSNSPMLINNNFCLVVKNAYPVQNENNILYANISCFIGIKFISMTIDVHSLTSLCFFNYSSTSVIISYLDSNHMINTLTSIKPRERLHLESFIGVWWLARTSDTPSSISMLLNYGYYFCADNIYESSNPLTIYVTKSNTHFDDIILSCVSIQSSSSSSED